MERNDVIVTLCIMLSYFTATDLVSGFGQLHLRSYVASYRGIDAMPSALSPDLLIPPPSKFPFPLPSPILICPPRKPTLSDDERCCSRTTTRS